MPSLVPVVLASSSPRRQELLRTLGVAFEVRSPDIDESVVPGESPIDYVRRLALGKSSAVDVGADVLVIAADTTVVVDDEILGKPEDGVDARRMLRLLSGRRHSVMTGIAVRCGERSAADVVSSVVDVVAIDDATLDWYLTTGEPFGKAGAYALQGAGGVLIDRVEGSVSSIIGLPLGRLVELCREVGVELLRPCR